MAMQMSMQQSPMAAKQQPSQMFKVCYLLSFSRVDTVAGWCPGLNDLVCVSNQGEWEALQVVQHKDNLNRIELDIIHEEGIPLVMKKAL